MDPSSTPTFLIDIANNNQDWKDRSISALTAAVLGGGVFINDVIFSEFSAGFPSAEACHAEVERFGLAIERIPLHGLFLAAQIFRLYRERGGIRTGTLPDFFIGAHAKAVGARLLTRDTGRYATYFPDVPLISP